jgi:ribosomal-protein-alanine N-acetyltransferase
MWATIYKAEEKYIGRCGLFPHFNNDGFAIPGEASLGLYIASNYWGRGFATEAGRAFVKFGFEELNISRIVTIVEVGNDASVYVIEKLGFVLCYKEEGCRSFYHYELKRSAIF